MKLCIILLALCSVSVATARETIVTHRGADGVPVSISVEAGPAWTHTFRIGGIIPVKTSPQIAVWIESPSGEYLATLYVSHRSATQDWKGGGESVRRPEALPCWSHRRGVQYADGLYMPTAGDPLPDAVTTATPGGSFTLQTMLPEGAERMVLFAEFNQSFDFNRDFPKNVKPGQPGGSGVSGQPSTVYSGEIGPESVGKTGELRLIGHGSPDGSDGMIRNDRSPLTSAKEIVRRITVKK